MGMSHRMPRVVSPWSHVRVGSNWSGFGRREVLLLTVILRSAWTWPRTTSTVMPDFAEHARSPVQVERWAWIAELFPWSR